MIVQRGRLTKGLLANRALVRPRVRMHTHVRLHGGLVAKHATTRVTRVGLLQRVHFAHVIRHGLFETKAPLTYVTLVRSLARMHGRVTAEAFFGEKTLATHVTHKLTVV